MNELRPWKTVMRLAALAGVLVASVPSLARADDALTPAQTKQVEQIIHDYLAKHPELLLDVMKAAEDQAKSERDAKLRVTIRDRNGEIFEDPSSPVGGNPNGDVTIVEFFDYRCPYCKQTQPMIETMLKGDPKLRIVYKEFPILGPESVYASRVALALRKQGKYDAFHLAMMNTKGKITEDVILKVAASVGTDIARAKKDMDAPEIDATIDKNMALADALDIAGTPAFIVGDKIVPGALGLDELKRLVADARHPG
jgi:protein-disulfide isomerase